MKTISFVTTVYNEEKTITKLLESIFRQTLLPQEIIIVDGGSTDNTVSEISNFYPPVAGSSSDKNMKIRVFIKDGNRSEGRNEGINKAKGDIIVLTDAGCILDSHWVEEIVKPFSDSTVDVVAGYYAGKASTIFQKCQIPYILVMPDRVDEKHFLPATRSMAIKKQVWKEVGGFPEEYSHNEDYVFAKKLKSMGKKVVFARDAIVYWLPKKTLKECFIMFFRHAYGDAEARIVRPKVVLLFIRYGFIISIFLIGMVNAAQALLLGAGAVLLYIIWSIQKNIRYCFHRMALLYLPALQFTADFAVIAGTIAGIFFRKKIKRGRI